MKIAGIEVPKQHEEVLVLPKGGVNIVFKAVAVLDFEVFEKINPMPQPKQRRYPDGRIAQEVDSPTYKTAISDWASAKTNWMILKSLEPSCIEWDTVDMSKIDTWANYTKDLHNSGFSEYEIGRIIDLAITACGLNQEKIDRETQSFLLGQGKAQNEQSSPSSGQSDTPSGDVVSDSK